ncbi:hypothetical protein [Micromonospora sp. WMMD736]|uniref:hypothetical protein n=1 Tax=Micromonospora sp. WMMD736 TaxID=3404112 RepID=UPI003B93C33E
MSYVKDIRITVNEHGTRAVALFMQFFEGKWTFASLEFVRTVGTLTWKPIRNPDVLGEAQTVVARKLKADHGKTPAGGVRRNFSAPTHQRIRPVVTRKTDVLHDPDVTLHDLPLSSYRAVVKSATRRAPVTPVTPTPQSSLPTSCDCREHTNRFVRGSARWRSHALSFGCVGEPELTPVTTEPARPRPAAPVVDAVDGFDVLLTAAEGAIDAGASKDAVNEVLRLYRRGTLTTPEALSELSAAA